MFKSFKFKENKYLDSSGIVHNKKLLSEILNKSYISCGFERKAYSADTTMPMKTILAGKNESKMYLHSNGCIYFGEGIKKVKISASFWTSASNNRWIMIRHWRPSAGVLQPRFSLIAYTTITFLSLGFANRIIEDIQAGDYIEVYTTFAVSLDTSSGNTNVSYVTIEEI